MENDTRKVLCDHIMSIDGKHNNHVKYYIR